MKIINRLTGQVYDIKNIDFNSGVVFGTSQPYKWANEKSEVRILETDTEFKNLVEELTATEVLQLPQYADYCKLSDYTGGWSEHPDCPERAFFTLKHSDYLLLNHKQLIDGLFETPINLYDKFDNGKLIYFWNVLSEQVKQIFVSEELKKECDGIPITVESRPENCDINGKLEVSLVSIPEVIEIIEPYFINPQP